MPDERNKLNIPYCFYYRKRKPEFIIKSERFLTKRELNQIARTVIQQHKELIFQAWMIHPKNKLWNGNVNIRKSKLLRTNPLPNPVIIEKSGVDALLKINL